MSPKFFSIGGMNPSGGEGGMNAGKAHQPTADELRQIPRYRKFFEGRSETSHSTTGFAPGEEIKLQGNPAVVLHEERDQHSGNVDLWVRESSETDSGTKKIRFKPDASNPRRLVKTDERKVRE